MRHEPRWVDPSLFITMPAQAMTLEYLFASLILARPVSVF